MESIYLDMFKLHLCLPIFPQTRSARIIQSSPLDTYIFKMITLENNFDICTLQKFHLLSSSIRGKKWDGTEEQEMEELAGDNQDENAQDSDEEEHAF